MKVRPRQRSPAKSTTQPMASSNKPPLDEAAGLIDIAYRLVANHRMLAKLEEERAGLT